MDRKRLNDRLNAALAQNTQLRQEITALNEKIHNIHVQIEDRGNFYPTEIRRIGFNAQGGIEVSIIPPDHFWRTPQ